MQESTKKVGLSTATIGAAIMLVFAPTLFPAAHAAPTLHGGLNCRIVDENDLRCTADVSGLGGATTAEGTLTATVVVTTGCITPSGSNEPKGLERTRTTVTETQEVNVESGRATFDITLDVPSAEDLRDCPSANMTPVIVCATFSNVQLTVEPNSGPSRTFKASGTFSSC
jgi:hypothetical protein